MDLLVRLSRIDHRNPISAKYLADHRRFPSFPIIRVVRGLSTPWTGATGTASLTFKHDQHNYCVHFSMPVE